MSVDYRQSALPPIGAMDRTPLKMEDVDYQSRKPTLPLLATAPGSKYNHAPPYSTMPPPLGAPPTPSTAPSVAFMTAPATSRKPAIDGGGAPPPPQAQSRLSLPSIQEALASDPSQVPSSAVSTQSNYQNPSPKSPHFTWKPTQSAIYGQQTTQATSTPPRRRPYVGHISPASPALQPNYPQYAYTPRSEHLEQHHGRPADSQPYLNNNPSPRQSTQPRPPQSWPPPIPNQYEHCPQPAESSSQPYAYYQAPSHRMYPPQAPPPSAVANPPYSNHIPYSVPPEYAPTWPNEDAEMSSSENVKRRQGSYADSVKRHLDVFDLESALDNIANASKQVFDFSHHYSQRAHQTQRSGPLPGSTPNLLEIDDMVKNGHEIQESLNRLREVIASQQAALAERSKDQYLNKAGKHPASDDGSAYQDGSRDGGPDKKRRGRAAPPGRCHSCNRAETPEWRRGPDGARTLCNACGLHYAKLTRKMGANKVPIGNSNLGLKQVSPGSPSM